MEVFHVLEYILEYGILRFLYWKCPEIWCIYCVSLQTCDCVKSVRIWSYSGPYSFRLRENTDQKNSVTFHAVCLLFVCFLLSIEYFFVSCWELYFVSISLGLPLI